jgi:hypothetical protein
MSAFNLELLNFIFMKNKRIVFVLLIILISGSALSFAPDLLTEVKSQATCPSGSTTVTPGNWSTVGTGAAGTTYCLADGTYTNFSVKMKNGDKLVAQNKHQAIMDGTGTTQQAIRDTIQNPQSANNVNNVTVDGLVFQNYRLPNKTDSKFKGVIDAGTGWTIKNIIVRNNDSGVVYGKENWQCSQGALVQDSYFDNNAWVAFRWNGTQGTFTGNTFINNGWAAPINNNTDFGRWDGSLKITNQGEWNSSFSQKLNCPDVANGILIKGNTSINNLPMGWWHDINVKDFVFEDNYMAFNHWAGFAHEIGGGGIVRNNTFVCNKAKMEYGGGWGGADIWIISSSGVTVENNKVTVCANGTTADIAGKSYTTTKGGYGIMLFAEARGAANNNIVKNNIVIKQGSSVKLAGNFIHQGQSYSNNPWTGNIYYTNDANAQHWNVGYTNVNFGGWQQDNRDTGMSTNSGTPPGGAFPQPGTSVPVVPPPSPTPTPTPTPTPPPSGGVTVRDHEFGSGYFVIEAENYNTGGEGVGFHDLNPGWDNALHRGSDGVDLTDLGSGNYAVNFMQTSEWLKYTLNVPTPGIYNVKFKASNNDGANSGALNLVVNSTNAGTVTINPTGSYSTFKDFSLNNISLSAGSNTFTVNVSDEWMDLDSIRFEIATATITCKGDYNNNGIVDISDFQLFGQNYKKTGLQCSYDIVGDDCLLTIADFQAFGQLYKVANACSTGSTPTPTPPPVNPPVTPPTNPPPVSGSYNPPAGIPAISITGAKFVSPDGNDSNAGTDSAPYKTINHGISQLQAGGTLVIKQGTYTVNSGSFVEGNSNAYLPIANKNGSANAWFKIVGDPRGSRPKIYAPWDGSSWQAFYIFQSSYIHLQYLEVYSNSSDAIRGKVSGVFSRNSHHVKVYDVWAHDGGGCGVCGQGSNHMEIRGNHVWNTSNWNEYNTSGISLIGVSNGGGGPDSSVSDSGGQYTNFIVGNLLWNNEAKVTFVAAPQWGVTDGNCIIMDVTNQQWRTLIANNICSDNAGRGVHAVHYNNADFFNNTLYQNVRSTMYSVRDGSELSSQDSSSIRFRNNVVWPRSDKNRFIMGGEASGNVWIGGNGGSSGVQAGTNTITRPDKNAPNGDWKINGQSDKGAPWPLEAFY